MVPRSDEPRRADSPVDISLDLDAAAPLTPIHVACAGLTPDERLQLFAQLTDLVADAHRHLRLQPGLEPRHVGVAAAPREEVHLGRGKLWGPGEAAPRALGRVQLTGAGARDYAASPAFASPEQLRGEPLTTASDLYSLGALLYVVCTGALPATVDATWPASRQRLPGDLEPVLAKAMAPLAAQRYGSVEALAADLRRVREGQPVSVQAPAAPYLAARFVQRHRLPVAVAGVALAAVLFGFGASAWQAERATQARDQAQSRLQAVRPITREMVLRYGDAVNYLPGNLAAKEGLLKGLRKQLEQLEGEAADDPEWLSLLTGARARLAQVQANDIGATLDQQAEARRNAQRALELGDSVWQARQHDSEFVASYAVALQVRGEAARASGHPLEGQRDLADAMQRVEVALSATAEAERRPLRLQHAALLLARARALEAPEQRELAVAAFDKAEVELRALAVSQPGLPVTALLGSLYGARAVSYSQLGRLDRASEDAGAAFQLRQAGLKAEPFNPAWRDALATAANNYAAILLRQGQAGPALQASEVAWAQLQSLARENGPHNPWIAALARTAQYRGQALVANGRFAEALPVLDNATALWQATLMREPSEHARRMLAQLTLEQARAQRGASAGAAVRPRA